MVYTNRACHNKRRSVGGAGVAVISALLVGTTGRRVAASPSDAPRVRSTNPEMLLLVREGTERSATFRALVDTVDSSNGIVYIEFGHCAFGHLNGCLLPFLASSHGDRYLRVIVTPDRNWQSHDQLLALIAHELRHALEVIEHPEVVDVRTMEALYRRIGTPETGGMTGYETSAARAAGDAVLAEVSAVSGKTPRLAATSASSTRYRPGVWRASSRSCDCRMTARRRRNRPEPLTGELERTLTRCPEETALHGVYRVVGGYRSARSTKCQRQTVV